MMNRPALKDALRHPPLHTFADAAPLPTGGVSLVVVSVLTQVGGILPRQSPLFRPSAVSFSPSFLESLFPPPP